MKLTMKYMGINETLEKSIFEAWTHMSVLGDILPTIQVHKTPTTQDDPIHACYHMSMHKQRHPLDPRNDPLGFLFLIVVLLGFALIFQVGNYARNFYNIIMLLGP